MNHGRGLHDPELELLDTGVFDGDRYWSVDVTYAKASPTDVLMRIELENHGPDEATLDVLPTLWFRNTWSYNDAGTRPRIEGDGTALTVADHPPRRLPARRGARPGRRRSRRRSSARTSRTHRVSSVPTRRPRTRRTGSTTTSSRARPRSTPRASAPRPRSGTASRWRAAARPNCDCGCTARRGRGRPWRTGPEIRSRRSSPRARAMPTSSSPRSRRRRLRPSRCRSSVSRAPASSGASRCTRTTSHAGSTATRTSRLHPRRTATDATAAGGTSTRSTCSRCRTPGSTRGSPPGISGSTRSRGRTSIRRSRSTS